MYYTGFTGTRFGMTTLQKLRLREHLQLKISTISENIRAEFHHGACIGSDEQAAHIATELGFWTVAHPPISKRYLSNFISCETRKARPYLERNFDIVKECDELIATPYQNHEIVRSGTWATIRYAYRLEKDVYIITP